MDPTGWRCSASPAHLGSGFCWFWDSLLLIHPEVTALVMTLTYRGFPDSLVGKESTAMQETTVQFLDQEDPLEKG